MLLGQRRPISRSVALLALAAVAAVAATQSGKPSDKLAEADLLARQPQLLAQAMVQLKPGIDPQAFAFAHGLRVSRPMKSLPNAWIMQGRTPSEVSQKVQALGSSLQVMWVRQDRRVFMEPTQFNPNDPLYPYTNANVWGQWHLRNTANMGGQNIDSRVWPAWQRNVTGQGVTIGIVDSCLEAAHPDLSPNFSAADSWDFGQNDADPSPVNASDRHGTSVAGVSAARGGNGIGVTGAAPLARLAGLRVDFPNQTESMFIDGTLYRSSGTTRTIQIKNHSYGVSSPYAGTPNQTSALRQSAQAGTIHVFAAGNWRGQNGSDTGRMDLQNEPSAITVAALGQNGIFSHYSNFGASVFVTAPSNSSGWLGILTTDRTGSAGYNGNNYPDPDYTHVFGGTSSASPLVAGVLALVKEVQPALNVRFAKHLLALCSDMVDPSDATATSDGGWKQNAAGYRFNQNYGFGLINADKLTFNAPLFSGVTQLQTERITQVNVNQAIPDNDPQGLTRTFTATESGPLEEVALTLDVTHVFRGDVEVYLTSPSGTTGRLTRASGDSADNIASWTFTSNTFWGEEAAGTWTVRVADVGAADLGTWNWFSAALAKGRLIVNNSLSGVSLASGTIGGGMPVAGTVTLANTAPVGGLVVQLSSNDPAAVVPPTVTVPAGSATVGFNVQTSSVAADRPVVITAAYNGGTATANLTLAKMAVASVTLSPASVKGGSPSTGTVALNTLAPAGGQVVLLSSSRPSATVPASVTVPAGSQTAAFPITTTGVSVQVLATIVARANGSTRFSVLTVDPPLLVSLALSPASVTGGAASTGTVTLDVPAGPGGFTVNLSSNRSAVTVPATVLVPEGSLTGSFTASTVSVPSLVQATLFATAGFRSRFAVLNVNPPAVAAHSVTPSSVTGGASSTGTVTLDSPAPAGGITVTLTSNRPAVTVPTTLVVPEGSVSASYPISTTTVGTLVQATLFAQFNGRSRWTVLNVNPPAIASHTLSPATVSGGASSTGTVTLDGPAPVGGLVVELSSNRPAASVPLTVAIPEGALSATYTVTTSAVASVTQATLVARLNGRTRWVVLTVNP